MYLQLGGRNPETRQGEGVGDQTLRIGLPSKFRVKSIRQGERRGKSASQTCLNRKEKLNQKKRLGGGVVGKTSA